MNRRDFCSVMSGAVVGPGVLNAVGALTGSNKASENSRSRPNLIFLMTDQQRWDALGCSNPLVHTPNLDRLAKRGIHFRQAVCNVPMCMPSRYSMMLGLYPFQTGIRCNAQMIPNDESLPAPPFPEILRQSGYQTAGFGKTHWYDAGCMNAVKEGEFRPSRRGFEVRACEHGGVHREPGSVYYGEDDPDGCRAANQEMNNVKESYPKAAQFGGTEGPWSFIGWESDVAPEHHPGGWSTNQCLEFLETGRDPSRPLFLFLSLDEPHVPIRPPKKYMAYYRLDDIPDLPLPPWGTKDQEPNGHVGPDAETSFRKAVYDATYPVWKNLSRDERRKVTMRYWAFCSFVDDQFGRVLKSLEQKGVLDHSLILFCSDHGEMLGERLYRTGKYNLYDGSVRVPLILSGSVVPENRRGEISDAPASLIDVLPTLLDGAGVEPPVVYPGIRLLDEHHENAGVYAEYHGAGCEKPERAPALMWRTKKWKLILYAPVELRSRSAALKRLEGELYNLELDPHEFNNLFDKQSVQDIQQKMTQELLGHVAMSSSLFPRPGAAMTFV